MSNFHRGASGWQGFRGGIADGRPGGRTPKKLPRQLLHGSPFHSSFQRDRRTLATTASAWTVFDDARGHIHVSLVSGSAVFETRCVRQFPSIIPGLLFCR